jgi:hypothetical protein
MARRVIPKIILGPEKCADFALPLEKSRTPQKGREPCGDQQDRCRWWSGLSELIDRVPKNHAGNLLLPE